MMEFLKIQNKCLEEQQWLDQEHYVKQKCWKKCLNCDAKGLLLSQNGGFISHVWRQGQVGTWSPI